MSITCKESHREGTSVYITTDVVLDAKTASTYSRYVTSADWDADPQAVTAAIADYLSAVKPPDVTTPAVNKNPVVMTDQEVADKLKAISDAKLAAKAVLPA